MKYINTRYILLIWILPFIFNVSQANAQTGLGTKDPQNALEVVTVEGNKNIVFTFEGKLGFDTNNPMFPLDIRQAESQIIGLGMTDQSAVDAGEGAMRYVPSPTMGAKGYMEYSDGKRWVGLYPGGKPRLCIIAEKRSNKTKKFEEVAGGGITNIEIENNGIRSRMISHLIDWQEKLDTDSGEDTDNFSPSTGEFIAPRDGTYLALLSFTFASTPIAGAYNNQIEAVWDIRDSNDILITRVKSSRGYSDNSGGSNDRNSGKVEASATCLVGVSLKKGQKLIPTTWIDLTSGAGTPVALNTNEGYNILTIVEL